MKELVEFIVRAMVDNPDQVQVEEVEDFKGAVLELRVAQPDMGRVIGKHGRVINAIRSLLQVRAAKDGIRVNLELVED